MLPGRFMPRLPALLDEEAQQLDVRNLHAVTKVAQEHLTSVRARATGCRAITLSYHKVYRPRIPKNCWFRPITGSTLRLPCVVLGARHGFAALAPLTVAQVGLAAVLTLLFLAPMVRHRLAAMPNRLQPKPGS